MGFACHAAILKGASCTFNGFLEQSSGSRKTPENPANDLSRIGAGGHEIIIMNTTFFSTFGALAIAGLSVSLIPATTYAGDVRVIHEHHINHLPRDARVVSVSGERCWTSGGAYYRINPTGGFVLFQPTVEAAVIEQPAVEVETSAPIVEEETTASVVEEPVVEEEDDSVVDVLPQDSQVIVINGENCWMHDGVYYQSFNHGFKVFHPYGKHVDHRPMVNRVERVRESHTVVNHSDRVVHTAHETALRIDHKRDRHS
jgi:hypothetical protein